MMAEIDEDDGGVHPDDAVTTPTTKSPAAGRDQRRTMHQQRPWMDHIKAPLPPCTLESLPEPIELPSFDSENGEASDRDEDDHDSETRRGTRRNRQQKVWPVLMGCYRLVDAAAASSDNQQQQRRSGQLELLTIRVPDVTSNDPAMPLHFESSATRVLDPSTSSGILDSKWKTEGGEGDGSSHVASSSFNHHRYRSTHLFATAHATGEVRVHALHVPRSHRDEPNDDLGEWGSVGRGTTSVSSTISSSKRTGTKAATSSLLDVQANVAVGTAPSREGFSSSTRQHEGQCPALCLSLNWRPGPQSPPSSELPSSSTQIVSTYSDGRVAIHDVIVADRGSLNSNDDDLSSHCHVMTRDCWSAHSMFTSPSEVWTAAFVGSYASTNIATGGDDATLKLWDVRAPSRPTTVLKDHFVAGVTCVSPHPRLEHLFVAGSYDESVNLYDVRRLSTPLCRSTGIGGGVWRLQWHPLNDRRLLVAAMHGGCVVTQFKGLVPPSSTSSSASASTTASRSAPSIMRPQQGPSSLLYPGLPSCPTTSFDSTLTETSGTTLATGVGSNDAAAAGPRKIRLRIKKTFEEHESMVYGASWLVCRHPTQPGSYFEAAASCSFYDQNVYVWDSVF